MEASRLRTEARRFRESSPRQSLKRLLLRVVRRSFLTTDEGATDEETADVLIPISVAHFIRGPLCLRPKAALSGEVTDKDSDAPDVSGPQLIGLLAWMFWE